MSHSATSELVHHPAHYGGDVPYEAIKVIEAWEPEWRRRGLNGFSLGSATKYICRAGAKGDPITDLQKARQYLDFEIARLKRLTPDEAAYNEAAYVPRKTP